MPSSTPPPQFSNAANLGSALDVIVRLIRSRIRGEEIAPEGQVRLAFFDDGSLLGEITVGADGHGVTR